MHILLPGVGTHRSGRISDAELTTYATKRQPRPFPSLFFSLEFLSGEQSIYNWLTQVNWGVKSQYRFLDQKTTLQSHVFTCFLYKIPVSLGENVSYFFFLLDYSPSEGRDSILFATEDTTPAQAPAYGKY